jgi:hypothetical protein
MLQIEILVGEGLGAVYAGRAGAIAVEEVATLAHEVGDLSPPPTRARQYERVSVDQKEKLTMRWNLEPLYPWGRPRLFLVSPVQNWRKFSAVRGTTSLKSSKVMRPRGSPADVSDRFA